jgi:hypothetical protein
MLIFVAFLTLSLNYTRAFQMKNELLTMIEKREGVTTGTGGSIELINNYLASNNYHIKGTCSTDSYGVSDLSSTTIEKVTNNKKYYYCITKVSSPSNNNSGKSYYKVNIYFYFNLPVIGEIFKFNVSGITNDIAIPADNLKAIVE